jgi:hypothetical protein
LLTSCRCHQYLNRQRRRNNPPQPHPAVLPISVISRNQW